MRLIPALLLGLFAAFLIATGAYATDTVLSDHDGVTQPLVLTPANLGAVASSDIKVKNVLTLGIKNDGTDQGAAINALLAAATDGDVFYFPKGTYGTSARLVLPVDTSVVITGDGPQQTWFKALASMTSVFYKASGSTVVQRPAFSGFGIKANKLAGIGMELQSYKNAEIKRIYIEDFTGDSALLLGKTTAWNAPEAFYEGKLTDISVYLNTSNWPDQSLRPPYGVHFQGTATDNHADRVVVAYAKTAGVYSEWGNAFSEIHPWGSSSYPTPYGIVLANPGASVANSEFDNLSVAAVKVNAGGNVAINGNSFVNGTPTGVEIANAAPNVSIVGNVYDSSVTNKYIITGAGTKGTNFTFLDGVTFGTAAGNLVQLNGSAQITSSLIPTLNQNTTGTAAGLSVTLATTSGGTGVTDFSFSGAAHKTASVSGSPADGCAQWAGGQLGSTSVACGSGGGGSGAVGSGATGQFAYYGTAGTSVGGHTLVSSDITGALGFTPGAVTSVSSANGDITVANGATAPALTLNSGNGANQILKLDSGAAAPSVNGLTTNTYLKMVQVSPPGAVTTAVNAVAGNLNGSYLYKITFVTADGETELGTASASVSPANQQVNLTAIPTGGLAVTQRKIYRTAAGGSNYYLLTTLANNTATTYTDNTADGSLDVVVATNRENTTSRVYGFGQKAGLLAGNSAGFGNAALRNVTTGASNTCFGAWTCKNLTTGSTNTSLGNSSLGTTTGSNNVAIGQSTLPAITTASANTAVGNLAGFNTTGDNNTFIGFNAGSSNVTYSKSIAIGSNAQVGASNVAAIGGTGSDAVNVGIGTSTPSTTLDVVGSGIFEFASDTAASSSTLGFLKSRTTGTATQNGDKIGKFQFQAYDSAGTPAIQTGGLIEGYVDGTVSAGHVPTRISFTTGTNSSDRAERLRIGNTGVITVSGSIQETVKANGTCSTNINIDPTLGGIHTLTLSGACAIGVQNLAAGQSFTLKLTQSSTTAPTFTSAYKWPAATAPTWSTSATKYDVLSCYSDDGTTLLCNGMVDVR